MPDSELGLRRPFLFCDSGDPFLSGIKVYARTATEDDGPSSFDDLWFQYWIWYEQDRDHQGDWELIQLRMDPMKVLPLQAAYAQHRTRELRLWRDVPKEAGRPVVFPSRKKHASYFAPGRHRNGWRIERANGLRPVTYTFRIIDAEDSRELSRPGRWGLDDSSPLSPGRQLAWSHPTTWANRRR